MALIVFQQAFSNGIIIQFGIYRTTSTPNQDTIINIVLPTAYTTNHYSINITTYVSGNGTPTYASYAIWALQGGSNPILATTTYFRVADWYAKAWVTVGYQ